MKVECVSLLNRIRSFAEEPFCVTQRVREIERVGIFAAHAMFLIEDSPLIKSLILTAKVLWKWLELIKLIKLIKGYSCKGYSYKLQP